MSDTQQLQFSVTLENGLIHPATCCLSPNQDARPGDCEPRLVIIHAISLPPGKFGGPYIEQLFANRLDWEVHPYFAEIRGLEVSSHLLIRRDGELLQFVPFDRRAWHAGQSTFRGQSNCNDFSIGIELEGCDDRAYEDSQYECLIAAIQALNAAYPGLDARTIAGHCDVSPGRKTDPGPAFNWLRLYDGLTA